MKVIKVTNLVWESEKQDSISMLITFEGMNEALPFSACLNDPEQHGSELFKRAIGGEFGDISPCLSAISVSPIDELIVNKRKEILAKRTEEIAIARGTLASNLVDYESKINRLWILATIIKSNPSFYVSSQFNGSILPSTSTEVVAIVDEFISKQVTVSQTIESIVAKFNALLLRLAQANTISEVAAIAC